MFAFTDRNWLLRFALDRSDRSKGNQSQGGREERSLREHPGCDLAVSLVENSASVGRSLNRIYHRDRKFSPRHRSKR